MPAVNLIPDEFKLEQRRRKHLRIWTVVTIIAIIMALLCAAFKYRTLNQAQYTRETADSRRVDIEQEIGTLSCTEDLLQHWQDRLALQRRLNVYPVVVSICAFLAEHSPKQLYLEKLELLPPEQNENDPSTSKSMPKMAQMFKKANKNDNRGNKIAQALAVPPESQLQAQVHGESSTPTQTAALSPEGAFRLTLQGTAMDYDIVADMLDTLIGAPIFAEVQLKRIRRDDSESRVVQFHIECSIESAGTRTESLQSGQGAKYANM